ncbi:hypothetical protein ACFPYJ_20150 [Paenibacillus solisilvae]|uniref:Secreted protein n=1 Tax=Paenibacillus solisilvae TaxID=2486751 RepID=A0ABW0VZS6_9BACL
MVEVALQLASYRVVAQLLLLASYSRCRAAAAARILFALSRSCCCSHPIRVVAQLLLLASYLADWLQRCTACSCWFGNLSCDWFR